MEKNRQQIITETKSHIAGKSREVIYTSEVQGGLKDSELFPSLRSQSESMSLLDLANLTRDLREKILSHSISDQIVDSSKRYSRRPVFNQNSLTKEILGQHPKILNDFSTVLCRAQFFLEYAKDHNTIPEIEEISQRVQAWEHTIREVSLSLTNNEEELNQLISKNYESMFGQNNSSAQEKYIEETVAYFNNPELSEKVVEGLFDSYMESAFTINTLRVLDRVQRPLSGRDRYIRMVGVLQGKYQDEKYSKFIRDNNIESAYKNIILEISKINSDSSKTVQEKDRDIEQLTTRFKEDYLPKLDSPELDDSGIDIVKIRDQLDDLNKRKLQIERGNFSPEQKRITLEKLDSEFKELLIPIANKVALIFPHYAVTQERTNLSDVLDNQESICAGKVNIFLSISKFLGVNGRANVVLEMLDGSDEEHICFECDLPSGDRLVIDGNFSNKSDPENIPINSEILIYSLRNSGRVQTSLDNDTEQSRAEFETVRYNPDNGKREIWISTVRKPHLITAPDRDGNTFLNSGFINNSKAKGWYLLERGIEINPNLPKLYSKTYDSIPAEERYSFIQKTMESSEEMYLQALSIRHIELLEKSANSGDTTEEARQVQEIVSKLKESNPKVLVSELYKLLDMTNTFSDEVKASLIDYSMNSYPKIFFSNTENVTSSTLFYRRRPDKVNSIYEEFMKQNENLFWEDINNFLNYINNFRFIDIPDFNNTAKSLIESAKQKQPNYYKKNVGKIILTILMGPKNKNPELAYQYLLEAKNDNSFSQNPKNLETLKKIESELGIDSE